MFYFNFANIKWFCIRRLLFNDIVGLGGGIDVDDDGKGKMEMNVLCMDYRDGDGAS